jgi:uncharacterized protein (DUF305 family)
MLRKLTLPTLLAVGALVGAGCGDDTSTATSPQGTGVDRAFATEMVPHHKSAIAMARIAQRRGQSDFVKKLAEDIVTSQGKEVAVLQEEDRDLADAGVEKGSLGVPAHMMGMDSDTATLRTATPFDAAFIRMMLPHHAGAIEMAKAELAKGKDPELKALAQDIIDAQQREVAQMRAQLG